MTEKCMRMGAGLSISRFKYLLKVNELGKWERARLQKFKLQPKTFYAFPYVFLLYFSVCGGCLSVLFNCQSFGGKVCMVNFYSSLPLPSLDFPFLLMEK